MTLRLSEEQLEIRAMARDFASGEIRPHAAEWDAQRDLDPAIFQKLGMNTVLQSISVEHQFLERTSTPFLFLAQFIILPLKIAHLGHYHYRLS